MALNSLKSIRPSLFASTIFIISSACFSPPTKAATSLANMQSGSDPLKCSKTMRKLSSFTTFFSSIIIAMKSRYLIESSPESASSPRRLRRSDVTFGRKCAAVTSCKRGASIEPGT
ncbi:hypothetical protein THAOC_31407 [Thalassiosira oceanica]|uniref:Uncharacterized protein n=1 Tax=Thalassiosira oceanica TaxID=159749 RepID=K0R9E6_THAOC|nr:hypothetical protein THAOC_31407 [Thalassiosira oceanica]|eukprot:EJK49685.1 hypothetical protein THAOC_31407 [Thalassiosira oceanica]